MAEDRQVVVPQRQGGVTTPAALLFEGEETGGKGAAPSWSTHSVGAKLTAVLSYLVGCHGVGKRGTEERARALRSGVTLALHQTTVEQFTPASGT